MKVDKFTPELAAALAQAVTGQPLAATATTVPELAAELADLGWDASRLAALRAECMASRRPWPFPVALERRRQLGFARFDALLAQLRVELGLAGTLAQARTADRALTADELRLIAEKPPHWG